MLTGKPTGKIHLGRLMHRLEDNIKNGSLNKYASIRGDRLFRLKIGIIGEFM